jgi:hypothetical protein
MPDADKPAPCADCRRGCGAEQAVALLSALATSAAEWRAPGPGGASAAHHRALARAAALELFVRLTGRRPTAEEFDRVLWRVPGEG